MDSSSCSRQPALERTPQPVLPGLQRCLPLDHRGYVRTVSGLLRVSILGLIVYGAMLYQTNELFSSTPTGFIPTQDKGYLLVNLRLPDSSSLERTEQVMRQIEAVTAKARGSPTHCRSPGSHC